MAKGREFISRGATLLGQERYSFPLKPILTHSTCITGMPGPVCSARPSCGFLTGRSGVPGYSLRAGSHRPPALSFTGVGRALSPSSL